MKIGFISLGCSKNLIDTEMMIGYYKDHGYEIVQDPAEAEVIVINTCGFIESAKKEAIDTILELVEYKKQGKIIIAMGCLVERYLDDLKNEIPEVDYYIPIKDYPKLNKIFEEITSNKSTTTFECANRVISTSPNYAYLRISEGCNNRCHYCAIPLIRGSFRSRPFDDIIMEAKYLSSKGITELNVISQDTSRYGTDINNSLANLLDTLANLNKFKLIRVLYLYPDEITDELLEVIKKHDSIVKYFDIPIQHASNHMLKAMNRRGDQELITSIINKIRSMMPDAIIRTTLIVGFPGETTEDFEILKEYVRQTKFDRLGVFTYSDEEDTVAYTMDNKIDDEIKDERFNEIMEIQYYVTQELNQKLIGKTFEVLVDHYDNSKRAFACRSFREAPDDVDGYIYLKEDVTIGNYYNVEITSIKDYDLIAKIK